MVVGSSPTGRTMTDKIKYRCRFLTTGTAVDSDWLEILASSPEEAANSVHDRETNQARRIPQEISFCQDEAKPGARVYFARVEVEGHGEWISRVYTSGIVRCGGVKPRNRTRIEDIAKLLKWERPASELLEDGWIGEEQEWH